VELGQKCLRAMDYDNDADAGETCVRTENTLLRVPFYPSVFASYAGASLQL